MTYRGYAGAVGKMRAQAEPDARPRGLPPVDEERLPREHPLHRPRHSRRQRTALVAALLFFLSPVLAAALSARPAEFENRELVPFPSLTEGWQFFPELSNWAGDHLPGRDVAVRTADGISGSLFGESYPFGQSPRALNPPTGPMPPTLDDAELARQRNQLLRTGFPQVLQGRDGWLYLGYDVLGACLPERPLDEVFTAVRGLRAAVEGSGRQFVLIPAPNKSTMVPQHLPENYVGAECAQQATNEFWRWMSGQPGVIDLRPDLGQAAARSATPAYSPVDTHWTEEGGLLMTRALAETVAPGSTRTAAALFSGWGARGACSLGATGTAAGRAAPRFVALASMTTRRLFLPRSFFGSETGSSAGAEAGAEAGAAAMVAPWPERSASARASRASSSCDSVRPSEAAASPAPSPKTRS